MIKILCLSIYILPSDLFIGKYKLVCRVRGTEDWTESNEFYVIFNPYGKINRFDGYRDFKNQIYDDDVFNPNATLSDNQLSAFVESEDIITYQGSNGKLAPIENNNFSKHYSAAVFNYIINQVSGLQRGKNDNAGYIARKISHLARQVIYGAWADDGKCPSNNLNCKSKHSWEWQDSKEILAYYDYPVNKMAYTGQCYTFALFTTSLFRSLGIPARPIGNTNDGVDENGPGGIGTPRDNKVYKNCGNDKLWETFHEWTEVWLPYEYKKFLIGSWYGWCAIDGTRDRGPHDVLTADQIKDATGPAPIKRIVDNISVSDDEWYDEHYFNSHVNVPVFEEVEDKQGNTYWKQVKDRASHAMFAYNPDMAGGHEDRWGAYISNQLVPKTKSLEIKNDEYLFVNFSKENYPYGDTIIVEYKINNKTGLEIEYYYKMYVSDISNSSGGGISDGTLVWEEKGFITTDANDSILKVVKIPNIRYKHSGNYMVNMVVVDQNSDQTAFEQDYCTVKGLPITVNCQDHLLVGDTLDYEITILNPLNVDLSNVQLRISYPSEFSSNDLDQVIYPVINANDSVTHHLSFITSKSGKYGIYATVISDSVGISNQEITVEVNDTIKLRSSIDSVKQGLIGDDFSFELNIENSGVQNADSIVWQLLLPDLFSESDGKISDTITLEGNSVFNKSITLHPVNFGLDRIKFFTIFKNDTIYTEEYVNVASFKHNIYIESSDEYVMASSPQTVTLKLINDGSSEDEVRLLVISSSDSIITTLQRRDRIFLPI